jgi:hypothetical protein
MENRFLDDVDFAVEGVGEAALRLVTSTSVSIGRPEEPSRDGDMSERTRESCGGIEFCV